MDMQRWISLTIVALVAASGLMGTCPAAESATHRASGETSRERAERLEPQIVEFVEQCDQLVVSQGRALTEQESELARRVGVSHPERVRVLVSDQFPEPGDPQFAEEISDLSPAHPLAETTGYGIQLTERMASSRRILAHELTHVGQFERWGIAAFMHEYLIELTTGGYQSAPLEVEARANERLGSL